MQVNRLTAQTLERFFAALAARDAEGIASCYAYGARYEDPFFTLSGQREIMAMWDLLFERQPTDDLWVLKHHSVNTLKNQGSGHWESTIHYSPTRRVVHNIVFSQFSFDADGLITVQRDSFDFWRWSRQAYGFVGLMMGFTTLLWDQARNQANVRLQDLMADQRRLALALPNPVVDSTSVTG